MAYVDICGSKLRSKLGSTLNESAASSPAICNASSSFAKRQMLKMGWQEGTGLGKNRDGRVEHIRIKRREDEMGLGKEKEKINQLLGLSAGSSVGGALGSDVWWKESVGGTLARLQTNRSARKSAKKKDKKKDKNKEKSKDGTPAPVKVFTDEQLFAATGGARFGMRAQRRAEAKWKRTEANQHDLEQRALQGMEWNGRGKPMIASKKRKFQQEECSPTHPVSPSVSDNDPSDRDTPDSSDGRVHKKRRKDTQDKTSKKKEKHKKDKRENEFDASEKDTKTKKSKKKKKHKEKQT